MIDDDRPTVGEPHLFGAVASGDQVDRGGGVVDDVDARRRI